MQYYVTKPSEVVREWQLAMPYAYLDRSTDPPLVVVARSLLQIVPNEPSGNHLCIKIIGERNQSGFGRRQSIIILLLYSFVLLAIRDRSNCHKWRLAVALRG